MSGRLARLAVLSAAALSACYSPPEPACGFVCGSGGSCPDGYACASDNVCHRDGTPASLSCANSGGLPFDVQSVSATGAHEVQVTFTSLPDAVQAEAAANYEIPGLTLGASPALSGATVTLMTSTQAAQTYTLTVSNVTRASDGAALTTTMGTFTGIAAFDVTGAAAYDAHSVIVHFDGPPDPSLATDPANYDIPGLTITGTPTLSVNDDTVTLPTSPQAAQPYTLTVSNVKRATDFEPLDVASASFPGRPPFDVSGAASTSHTTITVTFDAPPDPTSAMTLGNYSVDGGLTLSGTPALVGSTVTLTTSAQAAQPYTVTVAGVRRASDLEPLTAATWTFDGRSEFDVTGAMSTGNGALTLTFSDPPDPTSAMMASNYAFDGGLMLTAAPVVSGSTVYLYTSSQGATTYTVTVSNVTRAGDGEPLTMTSTTFAGTPCPQLAIMDDGTQASGGQDLVISVIQPYDGGSFELYNTTNADVDFSTTPYALAVPGNLLLEYGAGVIKAHGHLKQGWPAATFWPDETAGGELVLYKTWDTSNPANIVDFVCWDNDTLATSAKADAQSVGKWSTANPACASTLTGSPAEIARKDNATGTLGTDYDSAATVQPLTCPP